MSLYSVFGKLLFIKTYKVNENLQRNKNYKIEEILTKYRFENTQRSIFSRVLSSREVCARAITINDVKMHVPLFISGDASPGFNYRLEHIRSVIAKSFTSNNPCQSTINYSQNDNVASPSIVRNFDNNLFADILEIGLYIDRQPLTKILIFKLIEF